MGDTRCAVGESKVNWRALEGDRELAFSRVRRSGGRGDRRRQEEERVSSCAATAKGGSLKSPVGEEVNENRLGDTGYTLVMEEQLLHSEHKPC